MLPYKQRNDQAQHIRVGCRTGSKCRCRQGLLPDIHAAGFPSQRHPSARRCAKPCPNANLRRKELALGFRTFGSGAIGHRHADQHPPNCAGSRAALSCVDPCSSASPAGAQAPEPTSAGSSGPATLLSMQCVAPALPAEQYCPFVNTDVDGRATGTVACFDQSESVVRGFANHAFGVSGSWAVAP